MKRAGFEALVRRLAREVPPEYLDGVVEIVVSPRAVPHPTRADVFTLGECSPVAEPAPDGATRILSRVVLYHGSFLALAELDPAFDWTREAWETLTHELRHHLEWRAGDPALEAFDRAAEQNFARLEGEPFDPLFFLDGDAPVPGVYVIDDDYFLDHLVPRVPGSVRFTWHGRAYVAAVPPGLTLPAYLIVTEGVTRPPPGDLVLVLRRPPRLLDLFRPAPALSTREVAAQPV